MPRIGILSDIHGNLEAFEAVLRATAAEGLGRLVHLGDLIGYNANPRECLALSRERGMISVLGNHDLAALDPQMAVSFNVLAHDAINYSIGQLDAHDFRYLRNLPRVEVLWDEFLLCHGSPENIEAYIANLFQARRVFNLLRKCYGGIRVCFYGHTHVQKLWMCDQRGKVSAPPGAPESVRLEPGGLYLVNPGSVGQSRQGDNLAHYLVFDSDENTVWFRAVSYDVAAAQKKILAARLPEYLADRLQEGI